MMKHNGILVLAPVLAAGIALSDVRTVRAETVVAATVEWARRASLGIPVTGVVARVAVAAGDRVRSGQELVALDGEPFDAAVAAARAQVVRLDPDVAEARRELERAEDMYDRTLISEHDVELVRIDLARVEADWAHARAMLQLAEIERARSVLRAPFDGVVIERRIEVGEVVNAQVENSSLIVLGDVTRLIARARLEAGALPDWPSGLDVAVLVAGRSVEGRVLHVSLEPVSGADAAAAYAVDVEFAPHPETGVLIGQQVQVERR